MWGKSGSNECRTITENIERDSSGGDFPSCSSWLVSLGGDHCYAFDDNSESHSALLKAFKVRPGQVSRNCLLTRKRDRKAMKKSHLVALAKTMIAASFPVLREMTLELKVIDTDDYVMAVSLEGKVIHRSEERR